MVRVDLLYNVMGMFSKIPFKGWMRFGLDGGFRGASKNYVLKDGIPCTVFINKGYVSICCPMRCGETRSKPMHILLDVSIEVLGWHLIKKDAFEIYNVFNYLNK